MIYTTVEVTCGEAASEQFTYFRSPGFPQPSQSSRVCRVRIGKMNKNVCLYRVDMLSLDIAPPNKGNCSQDIFVVSGQNENSVAPKICGMNSGQHCKSPSKMTIPSDYSLLQSKCGHRSSFNIHTYSQILFKITWVLTNQILLVCTYSCLAFAVVNLKFW